MAINLEELYKKANLGDFRISGKNQFTVSDFNFPNVSEKLHEDVLQLILNRGPFPQIALKYRTHPNVEVLSSEKFIETLKYVQSHKEEFEPVFLVRRILETYLPCIIFESFMEDEYVDLLLNKMNK